MSAPAATLCTRWSLVDIGLNLTDRMYTGRYNGKDCHKGDVEAVLERGYLCGVRGLMLTGGSKKESRMVIDMCGRHNAFGSTNKGDDGQPRGRFLCTVGCHPTRCGEFEHDPDEYYAALDDLITRHSVRNAAADAGNNSVAAVGEVGLDYDRLFLCPKQVQLVYFRRQLALAAKHQLPLFLHDRNTGGDFYDIIDEHRSTLAGGVVHSFTGTAADLKRYLELGLYIGVNGCSLKTAENLEVVRAIPLDRLMIETDGPWCEIKNTHASRALLKERAQRLGAVAPESDLLLAPFPTVRKEKHRAGAMVKGRCEPCNLVQVLEVLHELHRETPDPAGEGPLTMETLAALITANTKRLFPF